MTALLATALYFVVSFLPLSLRRIKGLHDERQKDTWQHSRDSILEEVQLVKNIAAELASTGEQKALLISILLAHARLQQAVRGEPPLLLLDEIAAHLDASRRAALFDALLRLDSQAWLTGTDEALFAPLRHEAQFLSVRDGELAASC